MLSKLKIFIKKRPIASGFLIVLFIIVLIPKTKKSAKYDMNTVEGKIEAELILDSSSFSKSSKLKPELPEIRVDSNNEDSVIILVDFNSSELYRSASMTSHVVSRVFEAIQKVPFANAKKGFVMVVEFHFFGPGKSHLIGPPRFSV